MKEDIFYYLVKMTNSDKGSIDGILATYFIENFANASNLNIYDISDECGVSRSSIRRFCQKIGFNNFADMKKFMREYDLSAATIAYEDSNYRENLTRQLISITSELDKRMNTDEVDFICKSIQKARKFYLLVPSIENYIARNFKIGLAQCGKPVYSAMAQDLQSDLETTTEDDLIFVISVAGAYAKNITPALENVKATSILLTANRIDNFEKIFSKVYYMSHLNQNQNAELYREYAVPYFADIVINHYKNQIGSKL